MKTKLLLTLACLLTVTARAQVVSIVGSGSNVLFRVESYQAAELLSVSPISFSGSQLVIEKDGTQIVHSFDLHSFNRLVVAGPASIKVYDGSMATFRLTPEPYPPDRSILVAPGSGGATVTLECSTNLVDWTSTTNGVYTNLPVAKFFRIKADRIQ